MSLLFAAAYDLVMKRTEHACLAAWRAELVGEATGRVLEIGAGTGANLPYYPAAGGLVERLVLTEYDPHMRTRLEVRAKTAGLRAEVREASALDLPFPDASFDVVVSTLVLCTVPDPRAALAEARRVLAPGGKLVFLEHVAAEPGTPRRRWQGRIEPMWRHLAGGCHLTRPTEALIRDAGFELVRIERASMRRAPPFVRPTIRGFARVT